MFKQSLTILTTAAIMINASPATADWDVGDDFKMHYPQLPDLSPEGMDVLASLTTQPGQTEPVLKMLADDFLCTQSGPITDIHIWGSWLNDDFQPEPDHGTFVLGIYDDIPAIPGVTHSRPGNLLWEMQFSPGAYIARNYATAPEQFYDPNLDQIIGTDTQVWQYNFFIDEALAFPQEKDNIYWLAVTNVDPNNDGVVDLSDLSDVLNGNNRFGWKTSESPHFNDDAVFIDIDNVFGATVPSITPPQGAALNWQELRDPFTDESLDLSFVITPEPASLAMFTAGAALLCQMKRRGSIG